ncbi:prolipoprotein diacylglyceryl transferase [Desulfovibrio gilichinskyi]|uniref:Phosphatidylglycerol--prolipoprotein diacylglyceryl transferase n=1 Tax=Desulfovibrio gilichinskyi TaxID=1519643 RepID=A0A1X7DIR8_9BACT|nr:prolipoprotein diacylglyceryl transferase [Desulfovibrio gilichinskyi]SMF15928.1 Prolipoprotein diacylglyceryl transferase [Desulfovibrio gilichinskyi]
MIVLPEFDTTAFHIGPLKANWYGLMYMIGFSLAWLLGRYRASKPTNNWTPIQVDDLITWLVVGLVLGARIGYCLIYEPAYFLAHPSDIIAVWKGGMSFHGGAIGVAVVAWRFAKSTGRTTLDVGDFMTPLAPLGLLCGRMGNFINGELWGRVTDMPWGMVFPSQRAGNLPRHPSQLYEGGLEGLLLFLILWIWSSKPRPRGTTTGLFLIGYGTFRAFVEFFRQPDPQLGFIAFGWLTMGQLLCVPMILLGVLLFVWGIKKGPIPPAAKA